MSGVVRREGMRMANGPSGQTTFTDWLSRTHEEAPPRTIFGHGTLHFLSGSTSE